MRDTSVEVSRIPQSLEKFSHLSELKREMHGTFPKLLALATTFPCLAETKFTDPSFSVALPRSTGFDAPETSSGGIFATPFLFYGPHQDEKKVSVIQEGPRN